MLPVLYSKGAGVGNGEESQKGENRIYIQGLLNILTHSHKPLLHTRVTALPLVILGLNH